MKAFRHYTLFVILLTIFTPKPSFAEVTVRGCKDASGTLVFTTMDCEQVMEVSTRNQAAQQENVDDGEEDWEAEENTEESLDNENTSNASTDKENKNAEIDPDFFNEQVSASLVPENTVFESDDFLQELDPDLESERIPEYDEVIVEYALPGITEGECCIRAQRGTQHTAEKICLSRGKAVWRLSTTTPLLSPEPPHRVKKNCHIQITGKANSEYLYSCRTRAIAKCFWD